MYTFSDKKHKIQDCYYNVDHYTFANRGVLCICLHKNAGLFPLETYAYCPRIGILFKGHQLVRHLTRSEITIKCKKMF